MRNDPKALIGKRVTNVRHLLPEEIANIGWYESPNETLIIEFADGTFAIPMRDPEGNGPGHLYVDNYRTLAKRKRN